MSARPKILLLDDEQDLLDMYKEVLTQLPSQPEIHLANSGARAIALLESEPFTLLISDLKMPKMDGLQVLSIVRRKFPDLRVVVMTSMKDEQYRSRAYALGVDLFWEKPTTSEEIKLFKDCVASMLDREQLSGFRGVQSKSLVDIVQLECLSQNSSVLKITNGIREGKIWINDGNVIDSAVGDAVGHNAFKDILSWRSGAFEILPAEPNRPRTIFENYQGLLLDTAQALDEAKEQNAIGESAEKKAGPGSRLATLARSAEGVEFVLEVSDEGKRIESWGAENVEPLTDWVRATFKGLRHLGEKLKIGQANYLQGMGLQRHVVVALNGDKQLCIGFNRSLASFDVRENMKKILTKWDS
jgi:CheY-like chemotaxis protein